MYFIIIIMFVLFRRFTLSAVSPAVLVPSLLHLKRMGYGENGVNTMVIAASSLDDIVSISAFGVLLGIIFSTGTYVRMVNSSSGGFLGKKQMDLPRPHRTMTSLHRVYVSIRVWTILSRGQLFKFIYPSLQKLFKTATVVKNTVNDD